MMAEGASMAHQYVLLGDVVGSREIDDRAAFESTLRDACRSATAAHDGPSTPRWSH
jgi:hypothetical protein